MSKNSTNKDFIKQDVVQAVIFDFAEDFHPVDNYPAILTPIANIPLLDYWVEVLVASKVQEIYIYCTGFVDLIKKHVEELKKVRNVNITLLINENCYSFGDGMRDLDAKRKLRGDFILIRGTSLVNVDLSNFFNLHQKRVQRDKGAIMTMMFKRYNPRDIGQQFYLISNPKTRQIYNYGDKSNEKIKLDITTIWNSRRKISLDLFDTHVYMCSPPVLSLFSDNFDLQTMDDFVKNIVTNEEILNQRIYWEPLNFRSCGLPLTSWKAYNTISHNILNRHYYPLVPESIALSNGYKVCIPRGFYNHNSNNFTPKHTFRKFSLIGQNCNVAENSKIIGSVIGDNCQIGENVVIENSYILENALIQNNSIIKDSFIISKCKIMEGTEMDGCLVDSEIEFTTKNTLYQDSLITMEDGKMIVQSLQNHEDIEFFKHFKKGSLGDPDNLNNLDSKDERSKGSHDSEEDNEASWEKEDLMIFKTEVSDSLLRGYQEKLDTENLILEINSSRYAYNVRVVDVTWVVVESILTLPVIYLEEANNKVTTLLYKKTLQEMINFFHEIFKKYIKSKETQAAVLKAIENVAKELEHFMTCLRYILHYFYDKDLLEEKAILDWYSKFEDEDDEEEEEDDDDDDDEEFITKFKASVQPFIDWLREAEEEEDSSEDEDDE